MSYLPLARKYRPLTFSDLVGQEDTATAIANGIRLGREAQAIIFSGVRGIGKTTTARLYAKALNCDNGPTAEPCNQCASCLAINQGTHEDVLEIDGASNTGVEDVRILKETVTYAPQRSKYKVYIIDEVHMLSQSAFNALLKTLEEPPAQVVFLFATTELHKVPQTIISRCQTFHLSKFKPADIIARLQYILKKEGVEYEDRALSIVAKEAHGSMRDALTLLDQAVAFGDGKVSVVTLNRFVSAVSSTFVINFIASLIKKDSQLLLNSIEDLEKQGVKFGRFVEDLAVMLRNLFIVKELGVTALDIEMLALDQAEIVSLQELAESAQLLELNRLFRVWVKCRADLSGSDLDRYIVENVSLEWCLDPGLPKIEELLSGKQSAVRSTPAQVAPSSSPVRSDNKPRNLNAAVKSATESAKKKSIPSLTEAIKQPSAQALANPVGETVSASVQNAPEAVQPASAEVVHSWKDVVRLWGQVKPLQAKIFEDTYEVRFSANEIAVAVDETSLAGSRLLQQGTQNKVEKAFFELFGFKGRFRAIPKSQLQPVEPTKDLAGATQEEPETLREERMREKDEAKQRLREQIATDPITRLYMNETDSEIESIELS